MTRPNRSSVRKAVKERKCDDCSHIIRKGDPYFAQAPEVENDLIGPHVGWFYWCLPDAARHGSIAAPQEATHVPD